MRVHGHHSRHVHLVAFVEFKLALFQQRCDNSPHLSDPVFVANALSLTCGKRNERVFYNIIVQKSSRVEFFRLKVARRVHVGFPNAEHKGCSFWSYQAVWHRH